MESEQRHGGGKAQDMPRALWESQRASEEISLKLWVVTDCMFLFFHGYTAQETQHLTKNSRQLGLPGHSPRRPNDHKCV